MRKSRFILFVLILIAGCFLTIAASLASESVDIRGTITSVNQAEGNGGGKIIGRALIEGSREPDTNVDKAMVTVKSDTKLFIIEGGERKPVEFAALKAGQRVEARFSGPVMESYPVQATAAEITILER